MGNSCNSATNIETDEKPDGNRYIESATPAGSGGFIAQPHPHHLKFKGVTQDQMHVHEAKAIVLSCMDFRLLDDIVYFMNNSGYNNNYDQFILAGASLGYNQEKYPEWSLLFKTHVDLAEKLHHVKEVICLDHDKCGAYKLFYPDMKPEEEKGLHIENILKFEKAMARLHPNITLHAFFMSLDGSCEKIN